MALTMIAMPYSHGFLTERLKEYLVKDRQNMDVHKRAVYDFHVRESLKQSLRDAIFVLEKLEKKQFDKASDDLYKEFVDLLVFFSQKCYVDRSESKYPFGRIRKYRTWVSITSPRAMDILSKLSQDTLDKIYGKNAVYACFMPRNAYLDFKDWFVKNRDKVVMWKSLEENSEK